MNPNDYRRNYSHAELRELARLCTTNETTEHAFELANRLHDDHNFTKFDTTTLHYYMRLQLKGTN